MPEEHSPGGTATGGYEPFGDDAADAMEAAVLEAALSAAAEAPANLSGELLPLTPWRPLNRGLRRSLSKRLQGGARAVPVLVALGEADSLTPELVEAIHLALRADSHDAPSTHAEAVRAGEVWLKAEGKELDNHARNGSWRTIDRSEVPAGRRIHKMLWVYKVKRDGSAKARLCVSGNTLQAGIDYDQVFSAALRYSSARSLFAFAARRGCRVRSIDLVAAYLQGSFEEGEVVFCELPKGYPEYDARGQPRVARIEKPIYGLQQAGRRLQRDLFAWLKAQGFKQLDDSDPCIFTLPLASGEGENWRCRTTRQVRVVSPLVGPVGAPRRSDLHSILCIGPGCVEVHSPIPAGV